MAASDHVPMTRQKPLALMGASTDGKRTLAANAESRKLEAMEEEYRKLREEWDAGNRSREDSLRLLVLAWVHWADPEFVTGLSDDPRAAMLWHKVFAHFGGEGSPDAEFLHIAGMMARVFPPPFGDWGAWQEAGNRMTARSLELRPAGFLPELFKGRGNYGEYLEGQAREAPTHVWFPDWLKRRP